MTKRLGVYWYCGATQVKKTTKALADSWIDVAETAWPRLIIDSMGAWNFRAMGHVEPHVVADKRREGGLCGAVVAAVRDVWEKRRHTQIVPCGVADVDRLMNAARAGRRVSLFVDEIRFWMSKRSITQAMTRTLRSWAHAELIVRGTTQRIADVHEDALACHTAIYVFRTVSPADVETLWKLYQVPRDRVATLEVGEYFTVRQGQLERGGDGEPVVRRVEARPAADPLPS